MSRMSREPIQEPSSEHSAIRLSKVRARQVQLAAKLQEYQARIDDDGDGFIHPEQLVLQDRTGNILKAAILESVLSYSQDETVEKVYMHHLAVDVQDKTGLSVAPAATIPFVYNSEGLVYEPDMRRLCAETNPAAVKFSEAYRIIMAYCSGDMWGIEGGTGLPEV